MPDAKLRKWVENLRRKNMPVLGSVIADLNQITGSDESNANELAEVILRDPHLTSHVLRVANSVQYNYSEQKVNTISRAIVLIGLKGVRSICISLLILDRLLSDQPKERVLALVAQGFHAGTQARNLLSSIDAAEREEVFIAGLLFNLGEMSYLMAENGQAINADISSSNPKVRKAAIEETIGASFKKLTKELAGHWKLGDTLEQALFPGETPSLKVKSVIVGERLSRAALFGWDSPQLKKVLEEAAELKGLGLDETLSEIKQCADQATKVAESYGAENAIPLIPSSLKVSQIRDMPKRSKVMQPDAKVQLSILRELSSAANDKCEVNTIFQLVLEGMHRGVGLERVAIAFVDGHKLKSKYTAGEGTEHWRNQFLFDVGPYTDNIFTFAAEKNEAIWCDKELIKANEQLYPSDIVTILGRMPAVVYPLRVGQRLSAVFYADRHTFGGEIDQDQFESFKHFGSQAQLSLNSLAANSQTKLQ